MSTFSEENYIVFDVRFREVPPFVSDDLKDFWGGYKVEFKLISRQRYLDLDGDLDRIRKGAEPIGKGSSTRFEIDFSKFEFCDAKEEYFLDDYLIYGQFANRWTNTVKQFESIARCEPGILWTFTLQRTIFASTSRTKIFTTS